VCVRDSYVYQKGVLCCLIMKVMSVRLEGTVLSVIIIIIIITIIIVKQIIDKKRFQSPRLPSFQGPEDTAPTAPIPLIRTSEHLISDSMLLLNQRIC
jgi:hypothetical protein